MIEAEAVAGQESPKGQAVERIRERIVPWCRRQGVRLAVLFGSLATGRAGSESDIDLAVWPPVAGQLPEPEERLRWIGELQRLFNREISLVLVSPTLDPVLGFEIVRQGRVLYETEPNVWAWERLRLWQLYCDSEPFRRRQKKNLHAYAEEARQNGA